MSIKEILQFLKKGEKKKTLFLLQVFLLMLTLFSFFPPPINQSEFPLIGKSRSSIRRSLSPSRKNLLTKKLQERKTWHAYSHTEHFTKYKICKYVCDFFLVDALTLLFCVSQVLLIIILTNMNSRTKLFRVFLIYYIVIAGVFVVFTLVKIMTSMFLLLHPYQSLYKVPASKLKKAIDIAHFEKIMKKS